MIVLFHFALFFPAAQAQTKLLIPMDLQQTNHLKSYGLTFWVLERGGEVDWLLNYRGGSFFMDFSEVIARECRVRGVAFERVAAAQAATIYAHIQQEDNNMDVVRLEKAPRIAVYVPPNFKPWDDAVTLALEYAEISYTKVWDEEVLTGKLSEYDWLHLHHEDFTGQYGKFYANYRFAPWYVEQQGLYEREARRLGYRKVSDAKKAVARAIRDYVGSGGFMFAMCSATDSYDIALAAEAVDICDIMFDGDPPDRDIQKKLNFSRTFAFEHFTLDPNPMRYEYSDIDIPPSDPPALRDPNTDYFTLFEFSAKYDPVPTMLTQNHVAIIKGFMGQTTAFRKGLLKRTVIRLAEREGTEEVKYIHGNVGRGTFTWYGGHDPEDYQHAVGDPPTDLSLHKNSPGYRLILNNVLFPAAKKKQQKT
ncbi:MAG: asparagine synthetase B [Ignavibacteria bacterium]|nr:asparagine synthetase B [Ignavibacteria bacterium]